MSKIRIVTDTVSDVPDHLIDELGVTLIPMVIKFGQEEVKDRVEISMPEFLARLTSTKEAVRTSQPSPGEFMAAYRKAAEGGATVVSIQPSMKFSGAYQTACIARDLVADEGIRVEVVDTRNASMGQGWAVIQAARAALAGLSLEQVLERVRFVSDRVRTYLTLDTLSYLQRNGRLGRVQALVGSLFNLKPILQVKEGELALADAAVGAGQVMGRLVATVRRNIREGARVALGVVHVQARERAEQLRQELNRVYEVVETIVTETGPAIAANVGPGGYGAMLYEVD
ncbi:MAG: DegV family protein [Bacillota bacterium]